MVQDWYGGLDSTARERVIFYTLMGSHNQNSRSMVIDAEVGLLVAHWPGIIAYLDLITLIGQTRWLDTPADLDGLLPLDTGWKRRLANWVRLGM
jgi:phosphatidylserine/phosphatidylglycerophosphate/cardiolipin synthase-like enzyme